MPRSTIPTSGPQRRALQEKGQFWTPDWLAEAMAAYVLQGHPDEVFDPAVGAGALQRAVRRLAGAGVRLSGCEIDPDALRQARESGLSEADLGQIELRDFALSPPQRARPAIIANPPYLRHHHLSSEIKDGFRTLSQSLMSKPLDGRAGLHVYFLLRALTLLAPQGRLAFVVPADVCEGAFAPRLWRWIAATYRIEAVATFTPEASPFPGVDTNAVVLMLQNAPPAETLAWVCCTAPGGSLRRWVETGEASDSLEVTQRPIAEAIATGLSRAPVAMDAPLGPTLGDFVRVMRGVATGDNDFFFLTQQQADELGLPEEFLKDAIGRTRDVERDVLTTERLDALEAQGRPTLLLAPDERPLHAFPEPLRRYLCQGESRGLPERALIRQRNPWYRMERREPPPFLFAYLGRRNARFIRNHAQAVPLTGFLCVYPHQSGREMVEKLWPILNHPDTLAGLARVGKSYGGGAIKVEPRALERLPLPPHLVTQAGLFVPKLILEERADYD